MSSWWGYIAFLKEVPSIFSFSQLFKDQGEKFIPHLLQGGREGLVGLHRFLEGSTFNLSFLQLFKDQGEKFIPHRLEGGREGLVGLRKHEKKEV